MGNDSENTKYRESKLGLRNVWQFLRPVMVVSGIKAETNGGKSYPNHIHLNCTWMYWNMELDSYSGSNASHLN